MDELTLCYLPEFRLGYVLQVLGNIYFQERRWQEAFQRYQASLANYKATVGMNYHRTGHVCVKLAECHARLQQYETAEYVTS
jgi:tetratricopeptide (TPR) repeat protein